MPALGESVESMVKKVVECVSPRTEINAAYLFGSAASGRMTQESDIDVAVYAGDHAGAGVRIPLAIERAEARFPWESDLWTALERALGRNVDLVILDRAPAAIVAGVMSTGIPCLVRDVALVGRLARAAASLAEDFREFVYDFARIKGRSQSLSEIDKARLARILDFFDMELEAQPQFADITRAAYLSDGNLRRNVERWTENLINSSIDVAKIVLASQRMPMPQTYRETLASLEAVDAFSDISEELASFAALRNYLAHEYLDLRYPEIRRIVENAQRLYGGLVKATREWMKGIA